MSKTFDPTALCRNYEKPGDVEITSGKWIHPKFAHARPDTKQHLEAGIIVAVAAKVQVDKEGKRHGIHAVYFGRSNHWNKRTVMTYEGVNEEETALEGVVVALEMAFTMRIAAESFEGHHPHPHSHSHSHHFHFHHHHPDPPINSWRGSRLERVVVKVDATVFAKTRNGIEKMRVSDEQVERGSRGLVREAEEKVSQRDPFALPRLALLVEHLRRFGVEVRFWCIENPELENRDAHMMLLED